MLVNLGIHTLFTLILAYYYYNTFRLIPHFIQVYYISSLYYISTVQCSLTLFITTYLSQHYSVLFSLVEGKKFASSRKGRARGIVDRQRLLMNHMCYKDQTRAVLKLQSCRVLGVN